MIHSLAKEIFGRLLKLTDFMILNLACSNATFKFLVVLSKKNQTILNERTTPETINFIVLLNLRKKVFVKSLSSKVVCIL